MAEGFSISAGIASRYASALFDLALEGDQLHSLERDISLLQELLTTSEDFQKFISSPIHTRDETRNGLERISDHLELGTYVKNTLRLMATKRRLFVLPRFLQELKKRIDDHNGVVEVDVVIAQPLNDEEKQKLISSLEKKIGKEIHPTISIDPTIIGGMRVSVGSQLFDSSIRTKLVKMRNVLQEVD